VPHPHLSEARVSAALARWAESKRALLAALPDHVLEDATRDPTAIEERLAPYF